MAKREPVFALQRGALGAATVIVEGKRQVGGKADHGDDVFAVVVEDAFDFAGVPGADVVGVELGDEVAGDVAFGPLMLEHGLLQVGKAAALKPPAPKTAGGEQQVEVRRADLKKRRIERGRGQERDGCSAGVRAAVARRTSGR